MKYQFECTEAETLAYLGAVERMFDKMIAAIKSLSAAPASSAEPAWADAMEQHAPSAPSVPSAVEMPADPHDLYADLPPPTNRVAAEQTIAPYTPPKAKYADNEARDGRAAFTGLVAAWRVNLGVEDAAQPPRGDIMRDFANNRHSYRALGFVASVGGLMHACDAVECEFPDSPVVHTPEYKEKVRMLSTTICQVGSIFFHEISDLYEHRDIYREKK